jgi:hypothetical protein
MVLILHILPGVHPQKGVHPGVTPGLRGHTELPPYQVCDLIHVRADNNAGPPWPAPADATR